MNTLAVNFGDTEYVELVVDRVGNYARAIRVMKLVITFIFKILRIPRLHFQMLHQLAVDFLIRNTQLAHMADTIVDISLKRRSSSLSRQLDMFIDENSLVRMRTRLSDNSLSYNVVCPVVLSPSSKLTEYIILHVHRTSLHAGPGITLHNVRERFWIPRGRQRVRSVISRCIRCRRFRAVKYQYPKPPALPAERCISGCFENVGMDYLGPLITLDCSKSYVLLLSCATSRALHLELVPSLELEQFLLAFTRFAS